MKKKVMTARDAKKFAGRFQRALNRLSDVRDEIGLLREELESYEQSAEDGRFHTEKALEYLNSYI